MRTFNIIVEDDDNAVSTSGRRMEVREGKKAQKGTKMVEIPGETLLSNMKDFLGDTQELLKQGDEVGGPYKLDKVEVTAQISAEGKVGLLGSGVGLKGGAGIKFVFTR